MNIYGSRRSIQLLITSHSESVYEDAIDEARVVIRTRRKLKPEEKDSFGVITPSAVNNLRSQLNSAGMGDLAKAIDGSNSGRYGLILDGRR